MHRQTDVEKNIFLHSATSCFDWDNSHDIVCEIKETLASLKLDSVENTDQLVEDLSDLLETTLRMKKYALEYSYSPDTPQNGFTSFIKIVSLYLDKLLLYSREEGSTRNLEQMVLFLPFLMIQLKGMTLVRESDLHSSAEQKLETEMEIFRRMSQLTESQIQPFFNDTCLAFWLPESLRIIAKKEMKRSLKWLYPDLYEENDHKLLEKLAADKLINGCISDYQKQIRSVNKTTEGTMPPNVQCKSFTLQDRQSEWIIDKSTASLRRVDSGPINAQPVNLVIFNYANRKTDTVIYQIHGGSWMIGSPFAYANIFDRWFQQMAACVVSIDYSLSPDFAYPVALQEVVDGYLWLSKLMTSGGETSPLEFTPKDIVIAGDSAGGNLSLSLAIVLAELKAQSAAVTLPKAISSLYPCASPGLPYDTASMLLMDPIYPCTLPLKYICCYVEGDVHDSNESYLLGKNDPWFKNEATLRDLYTRVNGDRDTDAIFHILTYKHFDRLSSIPLFIQVGEYDQLVDCCISIAKVWKGPVTLDIIPDMIHTFAKMTDESEECGQADLVATQRLKEAVYYVAK